MRYFQGEHVAFCIKPGRLGLSADICVFVCVCESVRVRERIDEMES